MKFSLYLNNNELRLQKSNGPSAIILVPYIMDSSTPLLKECTKYIPKEWQEEINSLYIQEREIIKKRQDLMDKYKEQIPLILQPVIEKFPLKNPEYFV